MLFILSMLQEINSIFVYIYQIANFGQLQLVRLKICKNFVENVTTVYAIFVAVYSPRA